jgi:hypothetical protein
MFLKYFVDIRSETWLNLFLEIHKSKFVCSESEVLMDSVPLHSHTPVIICYFLFSISNYYYNLGGYEGGMH